MVRDLGYTSISRVIESWEILRRMDGYEKEAGSKLFQRLFEKCPEAKVLFGFPIDIDTQSSALLQSKRFLMHASYMIQMIDTALGLLGPDIELLTEIMTELGTKHVLYGVKPTMFPIMGECLVAALEDLLPKAKFTPLVKESWRDVYSALADDMMKANKAEIFRKTQSVS